MRQVRDEAVQSASRGRRQHDGALALRESEPAAKDAEAQLAAMRNELLEKERMWQRQRAPWGFAPWRPPAPPFIPLGAAKTFEESSGEQAVGDGGAHHLSE